MAFPYQDSSLCPRKRALDLITRMTVEEKIGQMTQISYNQVNIKEAEEWVKAKYAGSFLHVLGDDARHLQQMASTTPHKIPLLFGIDAVHGHALHNGATVFPSQLAMSCSWDPELIEKVGRATAEEVAADGLHWTFAPILCIGRDLRWGRVGETFGEDPYLIGVLASAIIRGLQGKDIKDPDSILACAKHYIAYGESTGGRDSYDSEVSMRKIREVFLPPFKRAVEAGCATFMSSYEPIDGTPAASSKTVLRDILKDELGFKGFVVTDWNNTGNLVKIQKTSPDIQDASKKTVEAGNDMMMNTPEFYDTAVSLVKEGIIPESLIDQAVERILSVKFSMGLFENNRSLNRSKSNVFACQKHLNLDLNIARESIVLLKNSGILPLGYDVKRIAVIGPNADNIKNQLGDWTFFTHPDPHPDAIPKAPTCTVLKGIMELSTQRGIDVVYNKSCDILDKDDNDIKSAVRCARDVDVIVAVIGDCLDQNGEGKDRADLNLSGAQQELLENLKSCNKPLIAVLVNGKPLSISWVAQNADAVIEAFNPGMLGGKAIAEIIFGDVNPSGRLSISFPYHSGQLPVYYNHLTGWHGSKYMDMPKEPLYSFGYGLSYTVYSYKNLKVSPSTCSKDDIVNISVDVTNTGNRDGIETVQIYVRDVVSSVMTPVKQLRGFKRVDLKAGETKTVELPLKISELAIVDQNEKYIVEPGEFQIMAGHDSRDSSLLKTEITVKC